MLGYSKCNLVQATGMVFSIYFLLHKCFSKSGNLPLNPRHNPEDKMTYKHRVDFFVLSPVDEETSHFSLYKTSKTPPGVSVKPYIYRI